MDTCVHQSMLEIEYKWTVLEAARSWKAHGLTKRSEPLTFSFLPGIEFYISAHTKTHSDDDTETFLSWKGDVSENDFECHLWKENDVDIDCFANFAYKFIPLYTLCREDYLTTLHCKLVYKKCPICVAQKALANEIQQLRNELTEQAASLIVERNEFATELIRMANKRDEWEAIAHERKAKLVDMTERSQLTTKQLNATVAQLKLDFEQKQTLMDNRPSTNNSESLWQLQKENKLTDFSLMVEGKSIQVHKNVLAIKSKFFAQQFEEHPEKLEYSIKGTTHEAVEQMVVFIYLGDTENMHQHLNELYKLSVRFQIDDLKEKCVMLLKWKLSIETSPEMFILAIKYKDEKLSQIVVEYVQGNGGKESLYSSNAFFHLLETDVKLYTEVLKALRC
ncbi:hypothetical protein M3Y94_00023500 [Aphelenchoides besseyi]|nr:hypothetical protein M3Y94_00023500 [Aphelenchoides besseyi]